MKITRQNLVTAFGVLLVAVALGSFIAGVSGGTTPLEPPPSEEPGAGATVETAVFAVG